VSPRLAGYPGNMKHKIAYFILRLSLGAIFLTFGIGKFQNDYWARTIKAMEFFINLPWDVTLSVVLVGILEVVTGSFLILGLFTRFFSAMAVLQLIVILFLLRFQEVRDIGLLGVAIYLALVRDEAFSIRRIFKRLI